MNKIPDISKMKRPACSILAVIALAVTALTLLLAGCSRPAAKTGTQLAWPGISQENRPWARWWWMGSSLDSATVSGLVSQYRQAGLGGLEITPIYGVRGYEDQFVPYLSPAWMDLLDHSLKAAARSGLGVDMATGTGWPFGGPAVGPEIASKYLAREMYRLKGGERLEHPVKHRQEGFVRAEGAPLSLERLKAPVTANKELQSLAIAQVRFERDLPLQVLMAYSQKGEVVELTSKVDSRGMLDWTAPAGSWVLYALFQGQHGKMVERAAPGGEGLVIDHFSDIALKDYLHVMDTAFAGHDLSGLRAFFNDSYEVDDARGEANWTPALLEEFEQRRGYALTGQLPALFGRDTPEKNSRVICDYRQTIAELLLEKFTRGWDTWAESQGGLIRNQAHGSPANILDLYAASDIPETEGNDILRFKFAASAGNVSGKRLISAEAGTWLNEHFKSSLASVKDAVDLFFLGGVNHLFYHGLNYSPPEEAWPGWLFYAAVHFSPSNPWWDDFGALNRYVARCQSFLQQGRADNDVLLYYPVFDRFSAPSASMLVHFDGMEGWEGSSFEQLSEQMQRQGYTFDFISDRQIHDLDAGGGQARVIMLPQVNYIPLETMEQLLKLVRAGATLLVHRGLPQDVPGLARLDARRKKYRQLLDSLTFKATGTAGIMEASAGSGRILTGDKPAALLEQATVRRESMTGSGLQFVRRRKGDQTYYFIRNSDTTRIDGWVPVHTNFVSAALFYPMDRRFGIAGSRRRENGAGEVYLQLNPGESCILQVSPHRLSGPAMEYYRPTGNRHPLGTGWNLEFVSGGPQLPAAAEMTGVKPWTQLEGEELQRFSGTATYTTSFPLPEGDAQAWLLDLGAVYYSARVKLNGIALDTLIGPDFRILVDRSLLEKENRLEISVSNLMGNRIAWMDREKIPWKKFYNINFSARLTENRDKQGLFTAAGWQVQQSGLGGPVTLQPVDLFVLPNKDE